MFVSDFSILQHYWFTRLEDYQLNAYFVDAQVAALRCLDGHMLGLFEPNKPE